MFDYDLVIVGGVPAARWGAIAAAHTGARVALVEPAGRWQDDAYGQYLLTGLRHQQNWSQLKNAAPFALQRQAEQISEASLGQQGVDVILGQGQFQAGKDLLFHGQNRCLRARNYLLAFDRQPSLPAGMSLETGQQWLPQDLFQLDQLPTHLTLLGQQSTTLEWAVALALSGTAVTLGLPDQRLLPAEDPDIQRIVANQLRALGIRFCAQDEIPAATSILLTEPHILPLKPLNLAALNLDIPHGYPGIPVNRQLRTRHPQVYAVGAALGGEDRPSLTAQEMQVALNNALFGRYRQIRYDGIAYGAHLVTDIGRVGLTEPQAQQRYGDDLEIWAATAVPLMAASTAVVNFCKLITLNNGRLVGAHLMGNGAIELGVAIAPAIRQGINMTTLAESLGGPFATPSNHPHSLMAVCQQAVHQKVSSGWAIGQWRRDWAENWFNWRRSRH